MTPRLRKIVRRLRRDETPQEMRLWEMLRGRRFAEFKFRRQVPLGPFVADFVCHTARLVLELDGGQHADSLVDRQRDAWLRAEGYRVLRIWNNELTANRDGVREAISQALNARDFVEARAVRLDC